MKKYFTITKRHIVTNVLTFLILTFFITIIIAIKTSDSQANTTDNHISVVDFTGQTVSLKKPAQRIVALAPHIVENVFSAGAGEQLVGAVMFSDFPQEALSLPLVGGYEKVNLEAIVELEPDLVIGWQSGNQNKIFQKIRSLGLPLYIDNPKSLEDVARVIKDIGILGGHQANSQAIAEQYLKQLQQLKINFSNLQRVNVFYQVWNDPLYTVNGQHIISNVIQLCGGNNIYANEPIISPVINLESLINRDPEVILASGMGEQRPEWLEDWKKWPQLSAVQKDNLYFVPPDIIQRHTLRILDGAQIICDYLQTARNK